MVRKLQINLRLHGACTNFAKEMAKLGRISAKHSSRLDVLRSICTNFAPAKRKNT
jgi:hypothetical protein